MTQKQMPKPSSMNGIFWLASYPKSGNTWFRTFLNNLLADNDEPVSINELSTGQIGSSRMWLDTILGVDSADLYQWEIDKFRPTVYEWSAKEFEEHGFHKIHDACWQVDSEQWLVSQTATTGALYFVRNPLDVAISYANHCNSSIDKAIKRMGNPEHCLAKNNHRSFNLQTEQRLLTWSQHVISWLDNPCITTHTMRYEDMKHQAQQTFTEAATYLNLPNDPDRIAKALQFSDFNVVQKQEAEQKFRERPPNTSRFFRKGIAGDWKKTLTTQQIDRVIKDHHEVMRRFGYLDEAGNPQIM